MQNRLQTITLKGRVGLDGILKLEVPTDLRDMEVEAVIVVQPARPTDPDKEAEWQIGFVERTYGMLADDPLELKPEQPLPNNTETSQTTPEKSL